jgi:serine/threonine protein kinase
MIGKTLAHYKVLGLLGKGGMGEVFRARDQRLDRDVALKFLPKSASDSPSGGRRFEREAKVLASLEHPNIAAVYGLHEEDGVQFIAMEFIAGGTLESEVIKGGLPLNRLLEIGIPVADAMSSAHGQGVIHRDLKPANVMRDASGRIRVLDFGLAGLRQTTPNLATDATVEALSAAGQVLGTVAYMAPEQLEGQKVDARADVFSIGVVLFELATGTRPFVATDNAGLASAVLRDSPPSLRDLRPDLPADLARVIRRCLDKNVERRLQTARDLCTELEDIQAGVSTEELSSSSGKLAASGELAEKQMTITVEHVRQLSTQIPRMVGDSLTYLDNEKNSEVLVVFLHGLGGDQREFEEILRQIPYRAMAPSLYGFGPSARMRPTLPYGDHNRLVGVLVRELQQWLAPQTLILVGHSSGSDQALQVAAMAEGVELELDGLILLGPAVVPGEGLISGPFSRMAVNPDGVFDTVRLLSGYVGSLDEWIIMHDYLICAAKKFEASPAALQYFAQTYINSLDENTFFESFRVAVERVKHVRCIFGDDDSRDSDRAMERHISDSALGDRYSEEMTTNVSVGHMDLITAAVILPWVEQIVLLEK